MTRMGLALLPPAGGGIRDFCQWKNVLGTSPSKKCHESPRIGLTARTTKRISAEVTNGSVTDKKRPEGRRTDENEFSLKPAEAHRYEDKDLQQLQRLENAEEDRATDAYKRASRSLLGFPEEQMRSARKLVAQMLKEPEDIEDTIREAADDGRLNGAVLAVIKARLDIAKREDEREVVEALDLLFRRVESEMSFRSASPTMRLLNDLLQLHDGRMGDREWLDSCEEKMRAAFPAENSFGGMILPVGFNLANHFGPIEIPEEDDDVLLRVDFVREVLDFLKSVEQQLEIEVPTAMDPESVAARLQHEQTVRTICHVQEIYKLAIKM